MPLSNDIARLVRTIDELAEAIAIGLKSSRGLPDRERQSARAELDRCVLRLDELRTRLGSNGN